MGERELVRYRNRVHDSVRWRGFVLRPGDIVLSTPPKCGTTWLQMICALLVLQEPVLTQPLSVLSPWLDMLSRARHDVVAEISGKDCVFQIARQHILPWSAGRENSHC